MSIYAKRQCASVFVSKPSRHGRNVNTFFNATSRKPMAQAVVRHPLHSQSIATSVDHHVDVIRCRYPFAWLRIFRFDFHKELLQWSEERHGVSTVFRLVD